MNCNDSGCIVGRDDVTLQPVIDEVRDRIGLVHLIIADPPYGNIVDKEWDHISTGQAIFVNWMIDWINRWSKLLVPGGAFYIWGGIGRPGFRPFFQLCATIEERIPELTISNLITWHKKRGYGVQHNYLFTREECLFLIKGDPKQPAIFNVPYLDEKRGYSGYDADHPALSEYFRRTNVWQETEILRGKEHINQKADRVSEIPIEVHTNRGDVVIDLFAGSGSTSVAAKKLGRRYVAIELDSQNEGHIETIHRRLAETKELSSEEETNGSVRRVVPRRSSASGTKRTRTVEVIDDDEEDGGGITQY